MLSLARGALALCLALAMAGRGLHSRSLDRSGAVAAGLVGVLHLACCWSAGAMLLAFYLSSSSLTKLRAERKAALDARCKPGGQRSWRQVAANSAGGAVASLTAAWLARASVRLHPAAVGALLGHYACCAADTWASELGMLSSQQPRLITSPSRAVPPGTNGGVTLLGLAASAGGGLAMGACLAAAGWLSGEVGRSLLSAAPLLGLAAGLLGSLVDSVLGASLQWSGYCVKTGQAVSRPGAPDVMRVSGRDVLSNDAVNALAAALSACACGWVTARLQ